MNCTVFTFKTWQYTKQCCQRKHNNETKMKLMKMPLFDIYEFTGSLFLLTLHKFELLIMNMVQYTGRFIDWMLLMIFFKNTTICRLYPMGSYDASILWLVTGTMVDLFWSLQVLTQNRLSNAKSWIKFIWNRINSSNMWMLIIFELISSDFTHKSCLWSWLWE